MFRSEFGHEEKIRMVKTGIALLLMYWAAIIAGVIGYAMNLFSLVHLVIASAPVTTMFIGRAVGVLVFPLGAFLGYF